MKTWLKRWAWPIGKVLLALAILVGVGRQFQRDLAQLDLTEVRLRPAWLVLSAGLYVVGLGFSGLFWKHLLHVFGQRPDGVALLRAYYIGHLGKYVPGKAWALLLRAGLVRSPDVRLGVAIISSFYEVLTTMAAGALLAAVVFLVQPPEVPGLSWSPLLTGLLLLGLCGIPLLPGVFNLLVARLARRFRNVESFRLPRLRGITLAGGILLTSCGWCFLGLSLWACLHGVLAEPPDLTVANLARFVAVLGLAYVAGFLAVVMPGGVGVREFFLLKLLHPDGPEPLIAAAVLLLRLLWTGAELITAAVVYCLPDRRANMGERAPDASPP